MSAFAGFNWVGVARAGDVSDLAYIFYSDGVCNAIPDINGERLDSYAIRRAQIFPSELGYIDVDCLIERYNNSARSNDLGEISVARYASSFIHLKSQPESYCRNPKMYDRQVPDLDFDEKAIYRDYTPEFYLLIARINQRYCRDFEKAYKYFLLAEKSGAPFRVTEKYHRY